MSYSKKEETLFKEVTKISQKEVLELKKNFFENKVRVLGISSSARSVNDMSMEKSNSEWLLEKCLTEAKKKGAKTKIISLRDYEIKPCKACYSTTNTHCHYPCSCYPKGEMGDDMTNKLYEECAWADVIIFATPINNFKISSLLSLFLDRLISMDGSLSPADKLNTKNLELNKKHSEYIFKNASNKIGSGYVRRFAGKIAGVIVTGHEEGASLVISQLFMTLNHYGFIFPQFSSIYALASVKNTTDKDKSIILTKDYEEEVKLLAQNLVEFSRTLKESKRYPIFYNGKTN